MLLFSCSLGSVRTDILMNKVQMYQELPIETFSSIPAEKISSLNKWFTGETEVIIKDSVNIKNLSLETGDRLFYDNEEQPLRIIKANGRMGCRGHGTKNKRILLMNQNHCFEPNNISPHGRFSIPTKQLAKLSYISNLMLEVPEGYECTGRINGLVVEPFELQGIKMAQGDVVIFKFDELWGYFKNRTETTLSTKQFPECGLFRRDLYQLDY
ncbi:MAG: hypothetical protein COW00_17960 [Bdellovibrio sp. CG12_big_fil_rev_8_21_14_0_65_39_13]|nr:MAG: hypothetical protein COW78_06210 [Bdellovibrio sp. CG22_combo_CG10-13_8_21_14_all_39_27]PIQ57994.1 MAG: hypothetical protein COW00_17960 [Bdellovibrio sp. CG12_big_fil_rev_8_21_14_0_65_39_13]PIR32871.1 MAG: hypothetical protein COV37_17380 [Bdellovibrio sp. CG11_big_fil_rev_8_21_14_0_20_39_38]